MKKQQIKAFTLVELIIVITILAILATIGFMSFQSYTTDARDGKRKADLGEIRNGLELYQAKKSTLPDPDAQTVNIMSGANVISVQGYLGATVLKLLRASDIKDPSDNSYYTYSVNSDKTKYQLLSMLENSSNIAMNNNLLNEAYAIDYTARIPYTTGNKVGIFFSGTTNNAPIQETMSGNLDLTMGLNATKLFKVMFSNSLTNSGTISATGSSLPAIVATETKSVASASVPICPAYQCLTNGYYIMLSTHATGCFTDLDTTYKKEKCILKIGDIYVAPGNSDRVITHRNYNATNCTSTTLTCNELMGTTTNGNAATFCTNLKNTIQPPVGTNWYLPPSGIGGLGDIYNNKSKLNNIVENMGYRSSKTRGSQSSGWTWTIIRTNDGRNDYGDSTSNRQLRCIAK